MSSLVPPEVEERDAEGKAHRENAASVGKLPWSKPTIWIGRVGLLTQSGAYANQPVENTSYYINTM